MGTAQRITARTIARAKQLAGPALAWWQRSRLGRMLARYGAARGGVLAGGIAYSALFSLFAALTIGYTVFMSILGGDEQLQRAVIATLASWLPGIIDDGSGSGVIDPSQLIHNNLLTWAGVVAGVVLLVSAISFVASLRSSIQAMFDLDSRGGALRGKLTELAGFALMCLAVFASAVVGVAVSGFGDWVAGLLGLRGSTFSVLVVIVGTVLVWALDAGVVAMCFVILAGAHPPRRDLLIGSFAAAAIMGVLRTVGTSLITGGRNNPLLASFAAIATLLVWVNLIARVVLMAAAWTANPPAVDTSAVADDGDAESQA